MSFNNNSLKLKKMKDSKNYLNDTVINYNSRIESFNCWANGSESASAEFIRKRFLDLARKHIFSKLLILDVGCGPGRDIIEFNKENDCYAIGLEPVEGFCQIILKNNIQVISGDIVDPPDSLKEKNFNCVFCLASLFHIPLNDLTKVFKNIRLLMNSPGILMTSFVSNSLTTEYKMSDGRWCTELSSRDHETFPTNEGFKIVDKFSEKIYNGIWEIFISKI